VDKKGQSIGMVTGLVFGIATLVIGVIIAFVLVSTMTDADLIPNDSGTGTFTVVNESVAYSATATSYAVTVATDDWFTSFNATLIMNGSTIAGDNVTLVEGTDYSIQTTAGTITNLSDTMTGGFRVTYPWVRTVERTKETVERLSGNFSGGVDNVSEQVPTVLLIAAIVLILGVLAILVGVWQKMRMGGGQL
jgi:hypothetical protein